MGANGAGKEGEDRIIFMTESWGRPESLELANQRDPPGWTADE